jgi:GNAT superfamily N-acetyltransferase
VSAYRFCRTDDIGLLVDALNRCWAPYFPHEPAMTVAGFKRMIRDLQVWCSSCMVAFAGADPIAVLIGAKRPSGTLIHRIAVHPDHRRQGHGRHLLASLGSKLAILGPPRIVAEVAEPLAAAHHLFVAAEYVEETRLTDYLVPFESPVAVAPARPEASGGGAMTIPITVDDLAANGLLEKAQWTCWERSAETLAARKDEIAGVAVASDERIEACVLYTRSGTDAELLALRSFVDDGGMRLQRLIGHLRTIGVGRLRFAKAHPAEIPVEWLETLGFSPAGTYSVYSTQARPG